KGPDLCFLDQPGDLSDEDRRRYERLGVPAEPFQRVQLYAPLKADGVNLNTLRTHPDLVDDVEPLTWGLQEVVDYAEVLLNRDDIDAKADAFIDFLRDRVLGRTFDDGFGTTHRVQTFADLDRFFRAIFDGLEITAGGRSDTWRTHHIATMRSEEHTSELQTRSDLVCRLLLEKKKQTKPTSPRAAPPPRRPRRSLGFRPRSRPPLSPSFFSSPAPSPPETYTLSLHDALPISRRTACRPSLTWTGSSARFSTAWKSRRAAAATRGGRITSPR